MADIPVPCLHFTGCIIAKHPSFGSTPVGKGPVGQEPVVVGTDPVGMNLEMGMDHGPARRGQMVLGDGHECR